MCDKLNWNRLVVPAAVTGALRRIGAGLLVGADRRGGRRAVVVVRPDGDRFLLASAN